MRDTIIKNFRQVGLALNPDGSEDENFTIKGLEDIVIGDFRLPVFDEEELAFEDARLDPEEAPDNCDDGEVNDPDLIPAHVELRDRAANRLLEPEPEVRKLRDCDTLGIKDGAMQARGLLCDGLYFTAKEAASGVAIMEEDQAQIANVTWSGNDEDGEDDDHMEDFDELADGDDDVSDEDMSD